MTNHVEIAEVGAMSKTHAESAAKLFNQTARFNSQIRDLNPQADTFMIADSGPNHGKWALSITADEHPGVTGVLDEVTEDAQTVCRSVTGADKHPVKVFA